MLRCAHRRHYWRRSSPLGLRSGGEAGRLSSRRCRGFRPICSMIASLIDRSWAGRGYLSRITWSRSSGMWVSWPTSMKTPLWVRYASSPRRSAIPSEECSGMSPTRGRCRGRPLPYSPSKAAARSALSRPRTELLPSAPQLSPRSWRMQAAKRRPSSYAASARLPSCSARSRAYRKLRMLWSKIGRLSQSSVPGKRTPGQRPWRGA